MQVTSAVTISPQNKISQVPASLIHREEQSACDVVLILALLRVYYVKYGISIPVGA